MALHKHRGAAKVAARKRLQREAAQESKASKGPASAGAKKKAKRK